MLSTLHPLAENLIGRLVNGAQRRAWPVIAGYAAAAIAIAVFALNHLAINTNTESMLSEKLPWRVTYAAYKRDFPFFADTIVIVIDGVTADVARDAAAALTQRLRATDDIAGDVFYPRDEPFLRRNQLLYLDPEELEELSDQLSEAQPFLARLSAERSSAVLFELLSDAVTADEAPAAVGPAAERIATAIDELNRGNIVPLSWQALLTDDAGETAPHREFVVVRPRLDYAALLPAEPAMKAIAAHAAALGLDHEHGVEVRLTGAAALAYDELDSVITGSQNAGTLALVMVLACLLIGLRSIVLVVATLVTLIVGLVFTAGFAIAAVGTLNMISIAFAVLYVGLGVDFAIHICLRYREMLQDHDADFAVNRASRHVGVSLIVCALTTATGFFAFLPTAYRGVAELGLIAGVGMFISLLVSITLLPALLHVLPQPDRPRQTLTLPDSVASFPRRHARAMLGAATVAWILAALAIPGAEFDTNPVNLNNPDAQSVMTYHDLIADEQQSPMSISAVFDSAAEIADAAAPLLTLESVSSLRSLADLVPSRQDEKLAIVDDLALTLGADLSLQPTRAQDPARTPAAIEELLAALDDNAAAPAGAALRTALAAWRDTFAALDPEARAAALDALDAKLLTSFDGRLTLLNDGLVPQAFGVADLPPELRDRWVAASGTRRLEIFPAEPVDDPRAMKRFVESVREVLGDRITGTPVINLGASEAVVLAFIQAFAYAFVVITGLLWLILRSFKDVAMVLTPLILAGLLTTAASVVFSLPFNFANIIALPLLLGIGVDSALHMLHRYKTALPDNGNLLQTSTARAVLFSALTTAVSFGNLAASSHAGTASMGVMLTIGIVATLVCTLLVLPAMLKQFSPAKTV
ncbi:MAG: MMPL family transporter [Gammaproteobacteria bacterium]|jgi:hopanoid biosynthesis associated RND transporter like protein HpnN